MKILSFTVTSKEQGMGLLSFLREKCKGETLSVKALKRAIDEKKCTVNGRVEYFSTHTLSVGDKVVLHISTEKKAVEKLTVLYEDSYLLICDKPAGLVVTPKISPHHLVHRLDKDTSGILIFAKTDEVKEKMIDLFAKREIQKCYLAIVDGILSDEGKMDDFLIEKTSYEGATLYAVSKKKEGKRAITFWKSIKKGKNATLALVEPVTGRTHQIRVQFHAIGHPILGDWQYAKEFSCFYRPSRQLLHSHRIKFLHPITQETLEVTAPLPKDFLDAQMILDL